MTDFRKLVSVRRLLAVAAVGMLVAGVLLVDPYPRQLVFGSRIRGKPRCAWEDAILRQEGSKPPSIRERLLGWFGITPHRYSLEELYNDTEMVPIVADMLGYPDPRVRSACVLAIKLFPSLQDRSCLLGLRKCLDDEDVETKITAADAIWHIDRDDKIPLMLIQILNGGDAESRFLAAESLAKMSPHMPELLPQLTRHARDPEPRTRIAVIGAMMNFGRKGLPALINGLSDPDAIVRISAINAIHGLGPEAKEAWWALEARVDDQDADVAQAARSALQQVAPERYERLKSERKN